MNWQLRSGLTVNVPRTAMATVFLHEENDERGWEPVNDIVNDEVEAIIPHNGEALTLDERREITAVVCAQWWRWAETGKL